MNQHIAISAVDQLHAKQEEWFHLSADEQISILKRMKDRAQKLSFYDWGDTTATTNGHDLNSDFGRIQKGFDMLSGASVVLSLLDELILSLSSDKPLYEQARPSKDGRDYYKVSPVLSSDRFKPTKTLRAEVWSLNIQTEEDKTPGVALVLGAGNQPFLAYSDVLYQLFVDKKCCILKHHPLRESMEPFFVELFSELIERRFFAHFSLDLHETNRLIHHEKISNVHMTGGHYTHDKIVWGNDVEANKKKNTPTLTKPMTSELGCITPWLICPQGEWTQEQLWRHAGQLAMAFCYNDSFNCLAAKVVLIDKQWPQYEDFVSCLKQILANVPAPASYYPGAEKRYQDFLNAYDKEDIEVIQSPTAPKSLDVPSLPWTLVHLNKNNRSYAFNNEAFAPILAICPIQAGNSAKDFLAQCTELCNKQLWGNLSCSIIIDDQTAKKQAQDLDDAIHALKYGGIAINLWTSQLYAMTRCSWGGYPGNPLDDISSGIGTVNNSFGVPNAEKSILWSSFEDNNQLYFRKDGSYPVTYNMCVDIVRVLQKPSIINIGRLILGQIFSKRT